METIVEEENVVRLEDDFVRDDNLTGEEHNKKSVVCNLRLWMDIMGISVSCSS